MSSVRHKRSHSDSSKDGMHNDPNGDVTLEYFTPEDLLKSTRLVFEKTSEYTAPGFSFGFLALFLCLTYIHETHLQLTFVIIAVWLGIHAIAYFNDIQDNFSSGFFWFFASLFGNILFYLFIGHLWSYFKLYLDVWQDHLPLVYRKALEVAEAPEDYFKFLLSIRWLIAQWTVTWPVSMVYTLSRDPLQIALDLAFEWSQQRYLSIIYMAIQGHKEVQQTSSLVLLGSFVSIVGYLFIGYIWTHVKLFIDVWQGRLPPSYDARVRELYNKQQSYWSFITDFKWTIMAWMFTWPFSMVYTIIRDPCRMIAEFVYKLSQKKYVAITKKAMEMRAEREAKPQEERQEEE